MKTYLADIIPKIQRFSQKLDNHTLLTNQHWVVIDEITKSKNVYIFRDGGQLLISQDGKVEKARWEYLGNNSLLIDRKDESYLFRHGFFDENILALKVDGKEEYAFLVNETKSRGELNSLNQVLRFLTTKYLKNPIPSGLILEKNTINDEYTLIERAEKALRSYETNKGIIQIEQEYDNHSVFQKGDRVFRNGEPAEDGKYKFGFMWFVHIKNGRVIKESQL